MPADPAFSRRIIVDTYPAAVDPATVQQRRDYPPVAPKILEGLTKSTLVYTCRYTRCEVLKESIESFVSPEGTIQASPQLNVLLVSDARELVPGLLKMIQELDFPVPQVLVEARVVEVTLDSDFEYEIKHVFTVPGSAEHDLLQTTSIALTTPGSSPNTGMGANINIRPLTSDGRRLDDFLRLLLTQGQAKILSSPNLIVGAGSEASIITGEEVPIQSATVVSGSVSTTTQFKRVGIKLRVIPLQIAGDTVKVEINPEVSTVTGFTAAGPSGVSNPIVAIRNVRSTLALKDGEIVTIGGLLRSEDREVTRKVPVLGDIPGLGLLFQSKRVQHVKTQLVFFLKIHILDDTDPHSIRFHRPGVGLDGLDEEVERLMPGYRSRQKKDSPLRIGPLEATTRHTTPSKYWPLEPQVIYAQPKPPEKPAEAPLIPASQPKPPVEPIEPDDTDPDFSDDEPRSIKGGEHLFRE